MNELAKTIQDKYIEDLTSKYPLHRFLMLFMVLFFMLNYDIGNHNVYTLISDTKIKDVFDFQSGILARLTILQFLVSLLLVWLLSSMYNKLNVFTFVKLTALHDFTSYTVEVLKKYEAVKRNDAYDFFMVRDIDKGIELKKVLLRAKLVSCEICMSLLICVILGGDFSLSNLCVIVLLVFGFLMLQWNLYKFYIVQFFPLYAAKNYLLNKDVSFENGYRND